jgi:hypothetical protein
VGRGNLQMNDIPWQRVVVIWPRKTISGQWVWMERVFRRRIWEYYGDQRFHMEPTTQYATLFEVIAYAEDDNGSAN